MAKLPYVRDDVEPILIRQPQTRNSDVLLYVAYCNAKNPLTKHMYFNDVMLRYKELGLASYDCVGRIRRKIQQENEELRACDEVTDGRYEEFKEYKEWALSE